MSEHSVDMTFEVVDQATGEVKPVFHINGQPTYVAELPGKNAERLAAYMRIRADLQDVERWLHQAYELLPKLDVNRIAKSDDTFVNSTDFMQATSAEPRPFFLRTPMGRLDFMDDRSMQFNTVGLVQHVATLVDNKIAELERKVVDEIRGSIPALFNTAMENSKTGG